MYRLAIISTPQLTTKAKPTVKLLLFYPNGWECQAVRLTIPTRPARGDSMTQLSVEEQIRIIHAVNQAAIDGKTVIVGALRVYGAICYNSNHVPRVQRNPPIACTERDDCVIQPPRLQNNNSHPVLNKSIPHPNL